nr:hypothetical protein [Tanacetum cinerariifolium]
MNEFYTKKGIRREFNNARTPQQNRVAKRRNRTLIKAARTMLADAKLPVTFWAEAVNTACYVQNRVLVNKSQNKTPYELFNSRIPAIGFLRPFGCHVMILNTLDHLGKFDAKGDEVVVAGTSSTNISGTKDVASQAMKKDVSSLRYIALPNWFHEAHMETKNSDGCNADDPKSSRISNPSKVPSAEQVEPAISLTVETKIPTVSSPVPTVCLDTSPGSSKEADLSNMETSISVSPTSTFRIHKDHPKSQIIGLVDTPVQTRYKSKEVEEQSFIATIHHKKNPELLQFCLFSCFLSQKEPKNIFDALTDPSWVEAMQEELLQFKIQNVWILVDCPKEVRPIGTKWVLKNKKDERGIVIRNKARIVAQGYTQEEGINYKEVFAPVAMIEAIRLFLAYDSFMGFIVYQMDVKSAFLYGTIDEELCREFKALMHEKFQMSAMGELTFFLGLQVLQKKEGIFLSQDKYVGDILKKFGYSDVRPDIMFAVCACARHQVTPKECHLHAVKRIFRYLKGHPKLGLWYSKDSPFDLVAYSNSDYGGATQDRKSTTGGCQFLGRRRYTRRAIWIAQSKALSPAIAEPASLSRDDRQGEAFPTVSSLDARHDRENINKTSALPHHQGLLFLMLIKAGIMKIREEVGADKSTELGSNDTNEMVYVLSSMEAANILTSGVAAVSVSPVAGVSTKGVPTVSGLFPTASAIFTTASVVTPYTRRSRRISAKDKGKEKVMESEVLKKRKLQEQIDVQVAKEMEEEFARENQRVNEHLTRDSKIARLYAKEELKIMIKGLDRSNEVIAKHLQEYEQAAADLSVREKIELINEMMKYQDHHTKILKYRAQQSKPLSKKDQREFYMSVLISHARWKTRHFRGMTLEEIKEQHSPHHDPASPSHPTTTTEPIPQTPTKTPTLRRYTKRAIRIAQSKALSPAADEPTSLLRDDRQREAFPTVSSLDAG